MLQGIKRAQVQQEWVFWLHATLKTKKKKGKTSGLKEILKKLLCAHYRGHLAGPLYKTVQSHADDIW